MDELYELVMDMKLPQLYVGERSLVLMFHFLHGYAFCKNKGEPLFGGWLFRDFRLFLAAKFDDKRSFNWLSLIQAHCPQGEDEIDFFYDCLDEFMKRQGTDWMYFDEVAMIWDNPRRCERAQVLSSAIKDVWGGTQKAVLDFGCGTGLLTFALSPYTTASYGYDTSIEMQRIFRSKMEFYQAKNVHLIHAEEMKELTFNTIFSSMVFHHIQDIRTEIIRLRQLLAPNGTFILIDLDKDDGAFHKNEPGFNGHNGFDRNEVQCILENCGFHDVSIKTVYKGVRPVDNSPVEYSLFLATARK